MAFFVRGFPAPSFRITPVPAANRLAFAAAGHRSVQQGRDRPTTPRCSATAQATARIIDEFNLTLLRSAGAEIVKQINAYVRTTCGPRDFPQSEEIGEFLPRDH